MTKVTMERLCLVDFDDTLILTDSLKSVFLGERWFLSPGLLVVGIRLFQCKTPYTPGMVTAILEATESFALIAYLACNHLGAWYDYVFGPLLMIVCFGMLQKTMTLLVGIRYSDMPKYVKAQWKRGNRA